MLSQEVRHSLLTEDFGLSAMLAGSFVAFKKLKSGGER